MAASRCAGRERIEGGELITTQSSLHRSRSHCQISGGVLAAASAARCQASATLCQYSRFSGSVSVAARSLLRCARSLHFVALSTPGKLQLMSAIPRHRKLVCNRA